MDMDNPAPALGFGRSRYTQPYPCLRFPTRLGNQIGKNKLKR